MRLLLSSAILTLGAFALPALASATTFYSSATSTPGNNATLYAGYNATLPSTPPDGMTKPTYDISPNGVWADPIGPSSWISFNPNTAPGGSYVAPNGYYDYKTNVALGEGEISLTVLADDTVTVYLNEVEKILAQASGPYPKCAEKQPNCVTAYTFDFFNYGAGFAVLDFEVHQAAGYSTGLDFYGTTVTPEPGSLILLGTGLLGGAGSMLRRFRRA